MRVLLRVAQRGGHFASLEHVAVHCQGHLRRTDQEGHEHLDRGKVPAVGLCLEGIDDRLDGDLLAQCLLAENERQHLLAGSRELRPCFGIEETAFGVGCPGHLLLAVGDAIEQLELGVGAADQILETVSHTARARPASLKTRLWR